MADSQLEIHIKTTADQMGVKLATDGIQKIKEGVDKAGVAGEQSFDKMGNASFRTEQRIKMSIVSMAGLNGSPLAGITHKFEYLNYMAANMNTTIGGLIKAFGPMAAVSVAIGYVAKGLKDTAAAGAAAFSEAGLGSRGWIGNLTEGLKVTNDLPPSLEKTDSVMQKLVKSSAEFEKNIARAGENIAKPPSEMEKLKQEREDIKDQRKEDLERSKNLREMNVERLKSISTMSPELLEKEYKIQTGFEAPGHADSIAGEAQRRAFMVGATERALRATMDLADAKGAAEDTQAYHDKLNANLGAMLKQSVLETGRKIAKSQIDLAESTGEIDSDEADKRRARLQKQLATTPLENLAAEIEMNKADANRVLPHSEAIMSRWFGATAAGTGSLITPDTRGEALGPKLTDISDTLKGGIVIKDLEKLMGMGD